MSENRTLTLRAPTKHIYTGGAGASGDFCPQSEPPGVRSARFLDALSVASFQLRRVLLSAPRDTEIDYTVDVKTHMLMPGQLPCIPGWHCDMVPREEGRPVFEHLLGSTSPDMLVWISGCPRTVFLEEDVPVADLPSRHADLEYLESFPHAEIDPHTWYTMSWNTPHRGGAAHERCWRTFVRMVDSRVYPPLHADQIVRRHSQVYVRQGLDW